MKYNIKKGTFKTTSIDTLIKEFKEYYKNTINIFIDDCITIYNDIKLFKLIVDDIKYNEIVDKIKIIYTKDNINKIINNFISNNININLIYLNEQVSFYLEFKNNLYYYFNCYHEQNIVKINNKIKIFNMNNKEIEEYKLVKANYEHIPSGISHNKYNFGEIEYKKKLINDHDINKNEITTDSEIGKKLLKKELYDIILLKNENLNYDNYKIIDII